MMLVVMLVVLFLMFLIKTMIRRSYLNQLHKVARDALNKFVNC